MAEPLRKLDYCLINDGGVCLILADMALARTLAKPPVRILASANVANLRPQYASLDWFGESCRQVAANCCAIGTETRRRRLRAGLRQLHANDPLHPRGLRLLRARRKRPLGAGRGIALGGELPINTSGGHTAEGYMQGFALQVEAVRQARGECGERQVPRARVVQYACVSPLVNSHLFAAEP